MLLKVRDQNYYKRNPTAPEPVRTFDLAREPAPTVTTSGLRGGSEYWLEESDTVSEPDPTKPPYRVPLMGEVAKVKPNGLRAISLFAGCGGSSLGYRMAGFRMLWANEFVDAARVVYEANAAAGTVCDGRDIRKVDPLAVLKELGLKPGELDVLDGSPPCASFSTAGKREAHWGKEKKYSDKVQRTDDLFFEYVRFLKAMQPRAFVAENVSGLVKGTAKGYFLEILREMKACGYDVAARLLDAQWLGVPQARQRIIFVGFREDLGVEPVHPSPLAYRYSVRDALPWIGGAEFSTGGQNQAKDSTLPGDAPAHTITSGAKNATHHQVVVPGGRGNRRRREEKNHHALDEPITAVLADGGRKNDAQFMVAVVGNSNAAHERKGERRSVDQPSRTVAARRVNLEVEKEADISKQAIGREYDKLNPGQSSEKYFSLVRADAAAPSPTVTAAGGQNSGIACVVHPTEKRKFTIAELKRICAFPDDFALSGTYAQQWERLGRAVPPVMMFHIASTVRDALLLTAARTRAPSRRSPPRSTNGSSRKDAGSKRSRSGRRTSRTGEGSRAPA